MRGAYLVVLKGVANQITTAIPFCNAQPLVDYQRVTEPIFSLWDGIKLELFLPYWLLCCSTRFLRFCSFVSSLINQVTSKGFHVFSQLGYIS